jgi:hypothetical protein
MKRAMIYLAIGLSAGLVAWKFTPSLIRELRQEFM